jgi:hypothetical protein
MGRWLWWEMSASGAGADNFRNGKGEECSANDKVLCHVLLLGGKECQKNDEREAAG